MATPFSINTLGLGFCGNECPVSLDTPHAHSDIEINFVTDGSFSYLVNGRTRHLLPHTLHLFWAATPHVIIEKEPGTRLIWVTFPLQWLVSFGIDADFMGELLNGSLFSEENASHSSADEFLLRSWILEGKSRESMRIILLEIEVRVRRLVQEWKIREVDSSVNVGVSGNRNVVERLAALIADRFDESLGIQELASGAGVHPNYAMQAFKRSTGMTLLDYRTQLRIHNAQRLLISTDMTLSRIALESGFGSDNRFYVAFRRICGCTPKEYRRLLGGKTA